MYQKLKITAVLFLVCIVCSACSGFMSNDFPEAMMRPPRLTDTQRDITDALNRFDGSMIMKYPKSGDYRSAFVFHDITGDNIEEALAFYAPETDDYTRIALLVNENGQWVSPGSLAGEEKDVEFISFAHITSPDKEDIIVGWSDSSSEKSIGIYAYENGMIHNVLDPAADNRYHECVIEDLDQDGFADILLLSHKSSYPVLKYLTYDGVQVKNMDQQALSDNTSEFVGVSVGRMSTDDQRLALFVDEKLRLEDDILVNEEYNVDKDIPVLATEVFVLENQTLDAVIYQDMNPPASTQQMGEALLPSLYERTLRMDLGTISKDINDDGIIEIPTTQLLPGYQDLFDQKDYIYLATYHQLTDEESVLVPVFSAAVNHSRGYMVEFPESWIGTVTIIDHPEYNEWRFFVYHEDVGLDNLSGEFARIRVVSQADYQNSALKSFQKFASRGSFAYMGCALGPPDLSGVSITIEELQELFALI